MGVQLPDPLRGHRPAPADIPPACPSPWAARIERALLSAIEAGEAESPRLLAAAVRHALFPGGARLRPRLCLAVSAACGEPDPRLADAAAAAVELVHCASLVHDDLPCFDGADTRRGQPSVHRAFGESTAVLAGDLLIVRAFEHLARACEPCPQKLAAMVTVLARAAGAPSGIVAGQAWESEPESDATLYRRSKTGALFESAAALGAIAAGAPARAWAVVGARAGEAYQIADDILDVMGSPDRLGKPVGRDAALGRPNAVVELGLAEARKLLDRLLCEAAAAVPGCADPEPARVWLMAASRCRAMV
jgi:geranylgeranyl diphosphate synthase type II